MSPGIYAWYYNPVLSDFDLDQLIHRIRSLLPDQYSLAFSEVQQFLDDRIFNLMREGPYQASISGPLKAPYLGELNHQAQISSGLVERIVQEPERLRGIREVLALAAPHFSSPLYMGMAGMLRTRLLQHRSLIERYRASMKASGAAERTSDAGFAWQVASRQLPLDRLIVFTCSLPEKQGDIAVDVENILNRLFYPILGRN